MIQLSLQDIARMSENTTPWKSRLGALSWVFVVVLFPSAWGGKETVVVVSGFTCLVALTVNYLATSSQPELRWVGGLILAGPLAALIVLNAFLNPHEVGLIPFWLMIASAIYVSATVGGIFANRK
jgi:hypothetical protein